MKKNTTALSPQEPIQYPKTASHTYLRTTRSQPNSQREKRMHRTAAACDVSDIFAIKKYNANTHPDNPSFQSFSFHRGTTQDHPLKTTRFIPAPFQYIPHHSFHSERHYPVHTPEHSRPIPHDSPSIHSITKSSSNPRKDLIARLPHSPIANPKNNSVCHSKSGKMSHCGTTP